MIHRWKCGTRRMPTLSRQECGGHKSIALKSASTSVVWAQFGRRSMGCSLVFVNLAIGPCWSQDLLAASGRCFCSPPAFWLALGFARAARRAIARNARHRQSWTLTVNSLAGKFASQRPHAAPWVAVPQQPRWCSRCWSDDVTS